MAPVANQKKPAVLVLVPAHGLVPLTYVAGMLAYFSVSVANRVDLS
jgi:hypothetical protein